MLFIDGDHSYEASRQNFELWSPFVVPHGMICLHDIPSWPGVTRFYQELMSSTIAYREVATVVSMKIIQKVPPLPAAAHHRQGLDLLTQGRFAEAETALHRPLFSNPRTLNFGTTWVPS